LDVGTVNGGVTTGGPATAKVEAAGVVPATDVDAAGRARTGHLGVATETEVGIGFGEQLGVHGTVRLMARGAAFAQGGVFIDKWTGLFPVALGAGFVQPRHGESAGGFQNVEAVGIVALHAIHFALQHGVMPGKMEFGPHLEMAFQTGLWVFAGVEDEFLRPAPAALGDMFAAGTVARFAAILAKSLTIIQMQPRVRAGGKRPGDFGVAVRAGLVPHVSGPFN